ncbi:Mlp lipoprotein family protein (plasmid) [Borrelia crocidurae DOU]|uniref:Mlp lipoprotein family protein n=1 Tax=Borrelia crocidurae DOU TaxID=1293575 RepID=W5SLJ3_9SPIR|nr:Mlp family lipoprotein [Borrelia crocidurae]AHH07745.1 Mlp lipoprotein family protein [Borrelia crocidurae DOU]
MNKLNILFLIIILFLNNCKQSSSNTQNKEDKHKKDLTEEQLKEKQKNHETLLKEKLSDDQKKALEFLKEALNNESTFNEFLKLDISKINPILDHIHNEVTPCTEDKANSKDQFKTLINGYFKTPIDDNMLNNFKDLVKSMCNQ